MKKTKRVSNRSHGQAVAILGFVWLLFATAFPKAAHAVDFENVLLLAQEQDLTGGVGTFSCYAYDDTNNRFYVGLFGYGTTGLRMVESTGGVWQPGVYTDDQDMVTRSIIEAFARAGDVPAGIFDNWAYATTTISGLLLNPAELTIEVPDHDENGELTGGTRSITYQPGELAFVVDRAYGDVFSGGTIRHDWTKNIFRWDLRQIGASTSTFPDYATSQIPPGGTDIWLGNTGTVDWNDALAPVFTAETMREAYFTATGRQADPLKPSNVGRQPAWSSDGQYLYCVDSGAELGGIYKVSAATGNAELLYSEPYIEDTGNFNLIAEPAVMPTNVCDLGAGFGPGDQILFDGTIAGGNPGALMYIVDTQTSASAPQVLIEGDALAEYAEIPEFVDGDPYYPQVLSIAADARGNVYFWERRSAAIHVRDPQGRLACIFNKAQSFEYVFQNCVDDEDENGLRENRGGFLRMQTYDVDGDSYLSFRLNNGYLAAIPLTQPGDLNGDDALDAADTAEMIAEYKKTCYQTFPQLDPVTLVAPTDYPDYINCDINGSSRPDPSNDGLMDDPAVVTWNDVEVLSQFLPLQMGDFDWDGDVLDDDDWNAFNAAFGLSREDIGGTGVWSWFDGDVTGDGLVDGADLDILEAIGQGIDGDLDLSGAVNSDDLNIVRANWGSSVTPGDISLGDADGNGIVNSDDLNIVRANWGRVAGSTVPEPGLPLLLGALVVVSFLHRRPGALSRHATSSV